MAAVEVVQLNSTLTLCPGTVVTGDTILNNTNGLMTICIGETTTVGNGKVINPKDGTQQTIQPGMSSEAVTFGAGEMVYLLNDRLGMSGTVDAFAAPLA